MDIFRNVLKVVIGIPIAAGAAVAITGYYSLIDNPYGLYGVLRWLNDGTPMGPHPHKPGTCKYCDARD